MGGQGEPGGRGVSSLQGPVVGAPTALKVSGEGRTAHYRKGNHSDYDYGAVSRSQAAVGKVTIEDSILFSLTYTRLDCKRKCWTTKKGPRTWVTEQEPFERTGSLSIDV